MNNPVSRVITVTTVIDGQNAPYDVTTYGRSKSRTSHSGSNLDTSYGTDGWGETAPQPTTTYPYIWRRIQHYNSEGTLTSTSYICDTGATGDNGDSAWSVQASQSPLIINQSRSNTSDFGLPIEITFTGMYGNNTATVGNVTATNTMGFQITGGAGKITINSYSKVSGSYVTSGTIVCTVPLTNTDGVTQNMTVGISVGVNLLGEFKREIDQDIETAMVNAHIYEVDPQTGQIIESSYLYKQVNSAQESITTLSRNSARMNLFARGAWKLNASGYPDAIYDAPNDRWYGSDEHTDIYSPVVRLAKGTYCFYGYVPSGRTFDTLGDTIAMVTDATQADPAGTTSIRATYAGFVSNDTVKINGRTYHRCYAVFILSADSDCSVNLWSSADASDIAVPCLIEGSVPDIDTSTSQIKQTADEMNLSITNKLGETGININGESRTIRLKAENTTIDGDVVVGSLKTRPDANGFFTEVSGGQNRIARNVDGTVQDVMRWGIFTINGQFSNIPSQIFYRNGQPTVVLNCYGLFSVTGEQTVTESAWWETVKYYHSENGQGTDTTGNMTASRWADTKGWTDGGSDRPANATADYYLFHCARRTQGGSTFVINRYLEGLVYSEIGTIDPEDMDIEDGTMASEGYYIAWDSDEYVGRMLYMQPSSYAQVYRVQVYKVENYTDGQQGLVGPKISYGGWVYYGYWESAPGTWKLLTSMGTEMSLSANNFGTYIDETYNI